MKIHKIEIIFHQHPSYIFGRCLLHADTFSFTQDVCYALRIPDGYYAKRAQICNLWTFWPLIQLE